MELTGRIIGFYKKSVTLHRINNCDMKKRSESKEMPRTKKDVFARLDAQFNEEEKAQIAKADSVELHFSLGMWIRNNWIYQQDEEDVKHLAELFGDDSPFFQADDLSGRIIESYQRHLRGIKKKGGK